MRVGIVLVACALFLPVSCAHHGPEPTVVQQPLQAPPPTRAPEATEEELAQEIVEELLVDKGLDRAKVHGLLYDPRLTIDTGFIVKNLYHSKPKGTAEKPQIMYYSPGFIPKGRAFIEQHREIFENVEACYGIQPEIITAILIIESKLGVYPPQYQPFRVYNSLAMALDPDVLSKVIESSGKAYPDLYREETVQLAQAKGRWALGELYHLILLSDELRIDPLEIKGSVAGAMGPAQFIPSTFRKFGADGDCNGRKDPFNMTDAIASVGHLLKRSGWTAGVEKNMRSALWMYNHSDVYVNTVMKIYTELCDPPDTQQQQDS